VEIGAIRSLVGQGFVVVCCGGGGIPVVQGETGLEGVRAVIDKDLTASMLATELRAELLVISTAVEKVALGFHTDHQRDIDTMAADELDAYLSAGEFGEGTMAPKVRAVLAFLRAGGTRAVITDPAHLIGAVRGDSGTTFTP
jgi:carbamate kinase